MFRLKQGSRQPVGLRLKATGIIRRLPRADTVAQGHHLELASDGLGSTCRHAAHACHNKIVWGRSPNCLHYYASCLHT